MKPSIKIFLTYILVLVIMLLLATSCSPVKQVIKDPDKLSKVGRYLLDHNFCINDTVTVSKDSIIYSTKDSIITDTVLAHCPDFTKKFSNGLVVTSKDGILSIQGNQKTITKTIRTTVTHNIRDKKLESVLREERDSALDKQAKIKVSLDETTSELKASKRKNIITWSIFGVTILGLAIIKFKKYIPFL